MLGPEAHEMLGQANAALWTATMAAAPLLIPVLMVGLAVGLLQALTSINEQTLTFVPKLIVVAAVLFLFGGTLLGIMTNFTQDMFAAIPRVVQ